MRWVLAANADISDHASWVASWVGFGHGVEVVVDPQRVPRGAGVGVLRQVAHHRPLSCRFDVGQVEPPPLGNEHPEAHGVSLLTSGHPIT